MRRRGQRSKSGLRDPDPASDWTESSIAGRREQGVGLIAKPAGPGRGSGNNDEVPILAEVCGDNGTSVLARQSFAQNLRQLTHLPGAANDIG